MRCVVRWLGPFIRLCRLERVVSVLYKNYQVFVIGGMGKEV